MWTLTQRPRRTALYRLYDRSGQLLYLGVAFDPKQRWRAHAKEQPWWPLVADRQVTWYPTREEAILNERPLFNVLKHRQRHSTPRGDAKTLAAIASAADDYRATVATFDVARADLVDLMREAYGKGEQQSAILRAAKHVWSREYQRVVLGLTKKRASGSGGE